MEHAKPENPFHAFNYVKGDVTAKLSGARSTSCTSSRHRAPYSQSHALDGQASSDVRGPASPNPTASKRSVPTSLPSNGGLTFEAHTPPQGSLPKCKPSLQTPPAADRKRVKLRSPRTAPAPEPAALDTSRRVGLRSPRPDLAPRALSDVPNLDKSRDSASTDCSPGARLGDELRASAPAVDVVGAKDGGGNEGERRGAAKRSGQGLDGEVRKRSRRKALGSRVPRDRADMLARAPGVPELLGDAPLRLIIVGANPSDAAWEAGHYYAHPANWFWRVLKDAEIAPVHVAGAADDQLLPGDAGVGLVDVGCGHPGTELSQFTSDVFREWAPAFYARLTAHVARAAALTGCCSQCAAPPLVAFAGKRQWMELLNVDRRGRDKVTRLATGPQSLRPQGWPLGPSTEVWVMPSTSGASPLTREQRFGPWRDLGRALASIPWPRPIACTHLLAKP